MAVSVSRDLSVIVSADRIANKLTATQQALRDSIRKGEPKMMGVSQVMLGLMVMIYSLPLLTNEFTEVVRFGVPWWSGLMFIIAGVVSIVMEKHASMKLVIACLVISATAILLSVLALILYFIDIAKNPGTRCTLITGIYSSFCDSQHCATVFSVGVKLSLAFLTIVQTSLCTTLTFILYKERRVFADYMLVN